MDEQKDQNTMSGSATRHGSTGAISGVIGAAIGIWLAKKGLTIDPDTASSLGGEVVMAAGAAGAAAAGALGALWRRLIS